MKIIWSNLSEEEKQKQQEIYNTIKKEVRCLINRKTNKIRNNQLTENEIKEFDTNIEIAKLKYNSLDIYDICPNCKKVLKLNLSQIRELIKQPNKKTFCNSKCCAAYVGNQYRENISNEDLVKRNKKISESIRKYNETLSEEEKQNKYDTLNSYWRELTPEQRSIRNKNNVKKAKQTKLERYGNANYNNITQIKKTYSEKYYQVPTANISHLSAETLRIIRNRELFKELILSIPLKDRCIYTIAEKLSISRSRCSTLLNSYELYDEIEIHRNLSKPQIELEDFIKSICNENIVTNDRKTISPFELDIYIPNKKVAIEYNGNYYHTTNRIDKKHHYNKSLKCEELGIRLIHIFEYEWEDERQRPILENIIKNALGVNTNKIYARNLKVIVKSSAEMKEFFNNNNIQGFRGGKFAICLADKQTEEIYMAYMMGNAFFGKGKYEWEVIRGATKLGCTVVGGASKIWNYFIKTYNPNNCVYYIDYNYFNGNSMKNLPNMEFIKTQFSFKNYWVKERVVRNREPLRHKEIKELKEQGLVFPIYNAGTKVYVWNRIER